MLPTPKVNATLVATLVTGMVVGCGRTRPDHPKGISSIDTAAPELLGHAPELVGFQINFEEVDGKLVLHARARLGDIDDDDAVDDALVARVGHRARAADERDAHLLRGRGSEELLDRAAAEAPAELLARQRHAHRALHVRQLGLGEGQHAPGLIEAFGAGPRKV